MVGKRRFLRDLVHLPEWMSDRIPFFRCELLNFLLKKKKKKLLRTMGVRFSLLCGLL